jgi:hypothetical protein
MIMGDAELRLWVAFCFTPCFSRQDPETEQTAPAWVETGGIRIKDAI